MGIGVGPGCVARADSLCCLLVTQEGFMASSTPNNLGRSLKGGLAGLMIALMGANPVHAFSLTILHNNDGESDLRRSTVDGVEYGGIDQYVRLIDELKAASTTDGLLTLSSGDNFLAGPEFNASLTDGTYDPAKAYDARALDAIGYDAIILGNHDFDFGPDTLADFIGTYNDLSGADAAPFLSSNLNFENEAALQSLVDSGDIAKSTVVETGGEQVGIIGATTPNLPFISSPGAVEVLGDTPAELASIVQAEIDRFTGEGVDKIIVVSHLQGVTEDQDLISQLSGVDVAIAGGGDELLANASDELIPEFDRDTQTFVRPTPFGPYPLLVQDADGNDVPVVTTTGNYQYIGQLQVTFDDAGNLLSVDTGSGPVVVKGAGDATVQADIVDPVEASIAELADNDIATSEVALDGTRSNIRSRETNEGNLTTDALRWQASQLSGLAVDVALQGGGGIRNDSVVPAGKYTELDTFDALPFSNFVSVFAEITVATLKGLLENGVSRIVLDPDAPDGFRADGSGTGRFTQVSGLSFEYNPALEPGNRVITVVLDDGEVLVEGGKIVSNRTLSAATNSFAARGGDEYDWGGAEFENLGVTYQQALVNYIEAPVEEGGLGGAITATRYPEGGEGRITQTDAEPVPEPSTVLGLLALAGFSARTLRKRQSA